MKTIVITKTGAPEVLQIQSRPDPRAGAGEVCVSVAAAGINFADILARKGLYPDGPPLPAVVGYEVAGEIAHVGPQIPSEPANPSTQSIPTGQAGSSTLDTTSNPSTGDTAANPTSRFSPGDRVLALTRFGGYAEKVVVPANQVFPIPASLTFAEAAALPVNYLTAWQLVVMGGVQATDTVLIHNAGGGVGLALIDLVRHKGARTLGTASQGKHERLAARGLDHAIDYRSEDWPRRVRELTDGKGVDLVFDPLGGSNWKKSFSVLRDTGRLGMYGVSTVSESNLPGPLRFARIMRSMPFYTPIGLMNGNKGVYGVNIGRLWQEKQKIATWANGILDGVQQGFIRPHVDAIFPFQQAAHAHRYIEKRQNFGKVVLSPFMQ